MIKQPAAYPFPYSKAAQLDGRITAPRPGLDPTLAPIADAYLLPEELDLDFMRGVTPSEGEDSITRSTPRFKLTEHSIPGPEGGTVILAVLAPQTPTSAALPALYHIHGGGMVAGDRFAGLSELLALLDGIECCVISVEYRLAPETRAPGAAEDCYAGLAWVSGNASSLGIDPVRMVVWGVSGGGALAAAVCLMARDRKDASAGIAIKGQMLVSPMLDDRCQSVSDGQFEFGSPWCGVSNRMAWAHVLGADRGSADVGAYQAPSRAEDLSTLPPAYIDAAECEVFRDPAVLYALKMWQCGCSCELHVWPGAFHLFDGVDNPGVPLIHAAVGAKRTWLRRMLLEHREQQ